MEQDTGRKVNLNDPLNISAIALLKYRLEVNAGRLCEPILKQGKNPKDDAECHKAFLMLAHLEAIENYLNDYKN